MMTVIRLEGGGYRIFAKGASEIILTRFFSNLYKFH